MFTCFFTCVTIACIWYNALFSYQNKGFIIDLCGKAILSFITLLSFGILSGDTIRRFASLCIRNKEYELLVLVDKSMHLLRIFCNIFCNIVVGYGYWKHSLIRRYMSIKIHNEVDLLLVLLLSSHRRNDTISNYLIERASVYIVYIQGREFFCFYSIG